MTGMIRRGLRLNRVARLGWTLAAVLPLSLLPSAVSAQAARTQTTLRVNAQGQPSVTVTNVSDDSPASGIVSFEENGHILGQSVLNAQGQAAAAFTLPAGQHNLQAIYAGSAASQISSATQVVTPQATVVTPSYQISLAPVSPSSLPMTLTAGQTGSLNVTVTPVNNSALTGPMFVTLSCSGLPSLSSCSFTPENIEITSTTPTSCAAGSPASACPPVSLMNITTQAPVKAGSAASVRRNTTVDWALLLPGILGLGGIAWGARRRRWLQRLSLIALVGVAVIFGATGCNPQYYYYNHGPILAPGTPAGSYTVTISAQTSNGVTSSAVTTTMVLTVQ